MADRKAGSHEPEVEETPFGPRRIVSEFTEGGHEIDIPPSATLFGAIGAMIVLIIASAFLVHVLFTSKSAEEMAKASSQPVMLLVNQADRDAQFLENYGVVSAEGEPVGYRMPLEQAIKLVLTEPDRFVAAAPPEGWVHPDDAKK